MNKINPNLFQNAKPKFKRFDGSDTYIPLRNDENNTYGIITSISTDLTSNYTTYTITWKRTIPAEYRPTVQHFITTITIANELISTFIQTSRGYPEITVNNDNYHYYQHHVSLGRIKHFTETTSIY